MKNIKKIFAIVFSFVFSAGCRSQENSTKIDHFLTALKEGEYDTAKSFFCENAKKWDVEGTNFYLKRTHEVLLTYGIPNKDKWQIKYDTTNEIYKIKYINIPILTSNANNKIYGIRYTVIEIGYDNTKKYIGDSIFSFKVTAK